VTEANGIAERETVLAMIEDNARPGSTVGGDKKIMTPPTVSLGDRWANDPKSRLSSQHHQP
jgi:hypothetical protein